MPSATPVAVIQLHFDSALRPLLRRAEDDGVIRYPLNRRTTIKDIVEALGVPHTEVGRIEAGARSVEFDFIPSAGEAFRIGAVPVPLDVTHPSRLRPAPLPQVRFVVDVNVGRLALMLRMLGLDTAYEPGLDDGQIAQLAADQQRIVLTRDTALLKRRPILFGRLIRSVRPDDQLAEVATSFGLAGLFAPFSRCLRCNRPLAAVEKAAIFHRLEPKTQKYFHSFKRCDACDRIYWRGSHHDAMVARLERILGAPLSQS